MVGNLKKITVFFKFPTVFLRKKKEKVRVGEGKFTRFTQYMYRMKTTSNKLIINIL